MLSDGAAVYGVLHLDEVERPSVCSTYIQIRGAYHPLLNVQRTSEVAQSSNRPKMASKTSLKQADQHTEDLSAISAAKRFGFVNH